MAATYVVDTMELTENAPAAQERSGADHGGTSSMAPSGYKTCSRCGEEKPLEDFYGNRRAKDGRQNQCKVCHRAAVAASQAKYPERVARRTRVWRRRNPDRYSAIEQRYRENNRGVIAERAKSYRETNPAKIKAHQILNQARRREEVVPPSACERCGKEPSLGSDGRTLIQAHHHDYSKPLEVDWLCPSCHKEIHLGGN